MAERAACEFQRPAILYEMRGVRLPPMITPISVTATPALRAAAAERLRAIRRHSGKDFVIVAIGQDRFDHGRLGRQAPFALRQTAARALTSISADTPDARQSFCRSPARPSETSIAADANVSQRFGDGDARFGNQIALREKVVLRLVEIQRAARCAVLAQTSNQAPHRQSFPVTTMRSPGFAPARRTILPVRHRADHRNRNHDGVRRAHRVAAEQRTAKARDVRAKSGGKCRKPGFGNARRQTDRQQTSQRRRTLRGEIGNVHPQRLLRDRVGADRRERNECRR